MIRSLIKPWRSESAQGRISDGTPTAVLDIGSNSVRLVIYERHVRALTPIYNEKVACGLGRGIGKTGELSPESVERALVAMRRFALVCELTKVTKLNVLATAATRDASNGRMFIEGVEEVMGETVRILSGAEEAYFAALGTLAGMPEQQGVLGDFGGGSLEFAVLQDTEVCEDAETHPIGAIRLQDDSDRDPVEAYKTAKKALKNSNILQDVEKPEFVAIGGTWRAIAKLHQLETDYPLHMIHGYRVKAEELIRFCDTIISDLDQISDLKSLSSNRRELLGYGAAALKVVLEIGEFKTVKFSALGVREGYMFEQLSKEEKTADPLLQACEELSILRSRSPVHSADLIAFSSQFVEVMAVEETGVQTRMREAACYLSDISWRGHSDYRGAQVVDSIAFGAFVGIDHAGRAQLARILAVRYLGLKRKTIADDQIFDLCKPKHAEHADMIGAFLRVAYLLSAAMPGILPTIEWRKTATELQLLLPAGLEVLAAEKLLRRLEQLATFLDLEPKIVLEIDSKLN